MSTGKIYLESLIKRLKFYKDLGDKTFEQIEDKDFDSKPNEDSNNIAMIIQHMAGNMLSRFTDFLTTDGEKDWRHRDREFEEQSLSRQQLLELWEKGWHRCLSTILSLTEDDLLKPVYIRQEKLLVIDALNRQLAHYPYHIGQIIYLGKILLGSKWKNLSIPKGESDKFNQQMK